MSTIPRILNTTVRGGALMLQQGSKYHTAREWTWPTVLVVSFNTYQNLASFEPNCYCCQERADVHERKTESLAIGSRLPYRLVGKVALWTEKIQGEVMMSSYMLPCTWLFLGLTYNLFCRSGSGQSPISFGGQYRSSIRTDHCSPLGCHI